VSDVLFEPIPTSHHEVARTALTSVFGGALISALQPVGGGASGALVYRVDVAGRPYLMRLETRRGPLRNPHQYVCMQTAAESGIAPPLHHADSETGVAIMDFLQQRPLQEYPGGTVGLARDLGGLVARLQATPAFPYLVDYLSALDRMLGYVRRSNVFAPGLLDRHQEGFERIREAYPWDVASLVSSHNDPNPRNIIFDGDRLWIVDWETAYRNDVLTDVAILVDNFAPTPELEDILLQAWFGCAPDRPLRARLMLMRLLTRLYYAALGFSFFAATPRTAPDADLTAPTPDEFRAAIASGRFTPTGPETRYVLGKMFLAGFLSGLADPRFEEALVVARKG
jgi:aminoglycoside phosphotransferase (APT) family kinase protein